MKTVTFLDKTFEVSHEWNDTFSPFVRCYSLNDPYGYRKNILTFNSKEKRWTLIDHKNSKFTRLNIDPVFS